MATARHVTKEQLFKSATDLFRGKALIWYRSLRHEVNNSGELVKQMREEFQLPDYDLKLLEENKHKHKQGRDESIGIYLAAMSGLFRRMSTPVPEEVQLKVIIRNIAPYYQTQLGLTEVTSLVQLRLLCRKLEASKASMETFCLPTRRANSLEPDLAYMSVEPSVTGIATIEAAGSSGSGGRSLLKCYNCGQTGHKGCLRPKRKHCYK